MNFANNPKGPPKMTANMQTIVILTAYTLMLAISYTAGVIIHNHNERRKASTKRSK